MIPFFLMVLISIPIEYTVILVMVLLFLTVISVRNSDSVYCYLGNDAMFAYCGPCKYTDSVYCDLGYDTVISYSGLSKEFLTFSKDNLPIPPQYIPFFLSKIKIK